MKTYIDNLTSETVKEIYNQSELTKDLHLWPYIQKAISKTYLHGWVYGFIFGWILNLMLINLYKFFSS